MTFLPPSSRVLLFAALILCIGLGLSSLGQTPKAKPAPIKSLAFHDILQTTRHWQEFPRWDGDRLVGFENNFSAGPILFAVDAEGRHEDMVFSIEGAASLILYQIARSPEGEIAVVGDAIASDQRLATFVARVSLKDRTQTLTRTWPYCPKAVTFAPDGTIWTMGLLKRDDNSRSDVAYHVLRHFDKSGASLYSRVIDIPQGVGDNVSYLGAARDRLGWLTASGEYIEFALDGADLGRYPGPDGVDYSLESSKWSNRSMAISADGQVVVAIMHEKEKQATFHLLNRVDRTWSVLSVPESRQWGWIRLLGFDGDRLVATGSRIGEVRRLKTE
jgi:hypothetical protein